MAPSVKDAFWAFVWERQSIWHRRVVKGLPPPWTDDEVLANHHFTNVYRELDKGTIWFQANRTPGNFQRNARESIVYRLLNRQQTFEDWKSFAGDPFPQRDQFLTFTRWLAVRMARGDKTFTGRHQVIGLKRYIEALNQIPDNNDKLWVDLKEAKDGAAAFRILSGMYGVGPFFANQVYLDLAEAGWYTDHEPWAYEGPGAKAALRLMFPARDLEYRDAFHDKMEVLRHEAGTELDNANPEAFYRPDLPGLTSAYPLRLKDVEHALCEFQKYWRVVVGEGAYKIEPGAWHDHAR